MTTDFANENTGPIGPPHPPWIEYLLQFRGLREVPGAGDNPWIVENLRLAGLPASMQHDETAWCGATWGRAMRESGISPPRGYAAARRWMTWGVGITQPIEGATAVFWRDDPNGPHGHVGGVMGVGPGTMLQILSGNQRNQVCIAPYPRARLLGLRWPAGVPLPAGVTRIA